jgi:hypothetical protein
VLVVIHQQETQLFKRRRHSVAASFKDLAGKVGR